MNRKLQESLIPLVPRTRAPRRPNDPAASLVEKLTITAQVDGAPKTVLVFDFDDPVVLMDGQSVFLQVALFASDEVNPTIPTKPSRVSASDSHAVMAEEIMRLREGIKEAAESFRRMNAPLTAERFEKLL